MSSESGSDSITSLNVSQKMMGHLKKEKMTKNQLEIELKRLNEGESVEKRVIEIIDFVEKSDEPMLHEDNWARRPHQRVFDCPWWFLCLFCVYRCLINALCVCACFKCWLIKETLPSFMCPCNCICCKKESQI